MKKLFRTVLCVALIAPATFAFSQDPGAAVYKANCAPCHGESGDSNTPAGKNFQAPPLTNPDIFKKSDEELVAFTKKGKGKMPSWDETLTDSEIKDVIAYIHVFAKK
jgi:mono/diheme cytochrome c family protein